jgi:hypothetical protein
VSEKVGNLLPDDYVRGPPTASEIKPGRVYVMVLYHENWCPQGPALGGRGPCRCTPEQELKEVPDEP